MELPFWSDRKKHILNFFWNACTDAKLPIQWGQQQILETMLLLDKLHFTLGVLKEQWSQIKKISERLNYCLSDIECNLYDDKLPVSRELLAALCNVAPTVLQSYDVKLARAIFICMFAGFMRCWEYTEVKGNWPNHNLLENAIICTDDKLGISFWSDKCSYNDPMVDAMVDWKFLPDRAKVMLQQYMAMKPKNLGYFFVKEDGQPLSREYFTNLLDVCILHTPWRFLHCMPHCFHAGGVSFTCLDGKSRSITDVKYFGCWVPRSKAIDHYTKTIFIAMNPKQIMHEAEHYNRVWKNKRLTYIARNVVQTHSIPGIHHVHEVMLRKYFPSYVKQNMQYMPAIYPSIQVVYRVALQKKHHALGTFIKKHHTKKTQFQKFTAKCTHISALAQRTIHLRSKGKNPPTSLRDIPVVHMANDKNTKPVNSDCQTDISFFHRGHASVQFPSPEKEHDRSLFATMQKQLVSTTEQKKKPKVSKPVTDLVSTAEHQDQQLKQEELVEVPSFDDSHVEEGITHEPQVLPVLQVSEVLQELGQENVS